MLHRKLGTLLPIFLLFAPVAFCADPPDGALTPDATELSYTTGPLPVPNVNTDVVGNGPYMCDAAHPCDVFELTVDVPDNYLTTFPKAAVKIAAKAAVDYMDIDLQVADAQGKNIALTRDNPPEQPSASFKVKNGVNKYQVQIVPGTPVSDASATIKLVPGAAATKSGFLGSSPQGGALGLALLLPLFGLGALARRRR